jgi:hypothetical protein
LLHGRSMVFAEENALSKGRKTSRPVSGSRPHTHPGFVSLNAHERAGDDLPRPVRVSASYEIVKAAAPSCPRISPAGFFLV